MIVFSLFGQEPWSTSLTIGQLCSCRFCQLSMSSHNHNCTIIQLLLLNPILFLLLTLEFIDYIVRYRLQTGFTFISCLQYNILFIELRLVSCCIFIRLAREFVTKCKFLFCFLSSIFAWHFLIHYQHALLRSRGRYQNSKHLVCVKFPYHILHLYHCTKFLGPYS